MRLPPGQAEEQVKPCIHCGALVTFADVYCLQCGNLANGIEVPEIPPQVDRSPAPTGWEGWVDRGALMVLLLAVLSLGLAATLLLSSG